LPHKQKGSPDSFFKKAFVTIEKAAQKVTGKPLLYLRDGASIPILSTIGRELGADAIMLGLATRESLMHSPNENVPIKLLENGRKVWKTFFLGL
jgi:acetylornithine deacetylase/succinyl-diaminopimelate desuccinylase-like protein